ncbi:hypothetical protein ABDD95_11110 [Mucilaginibacter sp. PAMB04274]|uniref:hypothetical protein n=1 Tax=Mucilaginibacter sp. PAMB04274 TaxID=3138568 RepID=UPI0031F6BF30
MNFIPDFILPVPYVLHKSIFKKYLKLFASHGMRKGFTVATKFITSENPESNYFAAVSFDVYIGLIQISIEVPNNTLRKSFL